MQTVATSDSTSTGRMSTRRPLRSDQRPATSSVGSSPTMYTLNIAVTSDCESPWSVRYRNSSGANWLAPHPTANTARAARSQLRWST